MRISDWSSDVCSSDLIHAEHARLKAAGVDFISPPQHLALGGVTSCYFYDPDGNIVELQEIHAGSPVRRSEEHTSELQSLMRISYAVFCLKRTINDQTWSRIQEVRYHQEKK